VSFQPRNWSDADWPARTFGELLRWSAETYGPDHLVYDFEAEDLQWTIAEVEERTALFARALLANGIEIGDKVAVWCPGRSLWPLAEVASPRVGAVVCGLNTRYRLDELEHVLSTLEPRLIFVATGFLDIDSVGLLREAIASLGAEAPWARSCELIVSPKVGDDGAFDERTLSAFLADGERVDATALDERGAKLSPSEPAIIQFTSGSTGNSKGVLISHDAAHRTAFNLTNTMGLGSADVMYSPLPFYHIGGTLCTALAALVCGARMVIPERFSAGAALQSIARVPCTAYQGHAAMYTMLVEEQRAHPADISALRKGWGSAPGAVLLRAHDELGMTDIVQTYGMSETGLSSSNMPGDPLEKRTHSIGRPIPGSEVSLRDPETEEEVEPGEVGEIWFKGATVMSGYLHDPEATAATIRDGWLRSGDLAQFDEDGFLHFSGRFKEMIKPGGENVSIAEVERFLVEDPRIREAAVVGVPDDRLGEVPVAVVQLAAGEELGEEEIIARCAGGIANFKVPRRVWIVDHVPMMEMGKVDRRAVREFVTETLTTGAA